MRGGQAPPPEGDGRPTARAYGTLIRKQQENGFGTVHTFEAPVYSEGITLALRFMNQGADVMIAFNIYVRRNFHLGHDT